MAVDEPDQHTVTERIAATLNRRRRSDGALRPAGDIGDSLLSAFCPWSGLRTSAEVLRFPWCILRHFRLNGQYAESFYPRPIRNQRLFRPLSLGCRGLAEHRLKRVSGVFVAQSRMEGGPYDWDYFNNPPNSRFVRRWMGVQIRMVRWVWTGRHRL